MSLHSMRCMLCSGILVAVGNAAIADEGAAERNRLTLEASQDIIPGTIHFLDCSPDGSLVLASSTGGFVVLDSSDLELKKVLPIGGWWAAYSASGEWVIVSQLVQFQNPRVERLKIIKADTHEEVSTFPGFPEFRVHPKQNMLATIGARQTPIGYNTLLLCDLPTGEVLHRHKVEGTRFTVPPLKISASGIVGFRSSTSSMMVWFPPYEQAPLRIEVGSYVTAMDFSPDGRVAAFGTSKGQVELWNLQTATRIRNLDRHQGRPFKIGSVSYSSNGKYLVSVSSATCETIVWETTGFTEIARVDAHEGMGGSMAFCGDTQRFVTAAGLNSNIKVWRIND